MEITQIKSFNFSEKKKRVPRAVFQENSIFMKLRYFNPRKLNNR